MSSSSSSSSSSTQNNTVQSNYSNNLQITKEKEYELQQIAIKDSLMNGLYTFGVTVSIFTYFALKPKSTLLRLTNISSRAAILLMPTGFIVHLTSEQRYIQLLRQVSYDRDNTLQTIIWAEHQYKNKNKNSTSDSDDIDINNTNRSKQLQQLYQLSLEKDKNICIVQSNELEWYHHMSNYIADNTFKMTVGCAVPTYLSIFAYVRTIKTHVSFGQCILQTRVYGQVTAIFYTVLFTSYNSYMNTHGRYIGVHDANNRIKEMELLHSNLYTSTPSNKKNNNNDTNSKKKKNIKKDNNENNNENTATTSTSTAITAEI